MRRSPSPRWGEVLHGGVLQQGVGFQPLYDTEGKFEALEFAAGNFGLLESAYAYEKDDVAPQVRLSVGDPTRARSTRRSSS